MRSFMMANFNLTATPHDDETEPVINATEPIVASEQDAQFSPNSEDGIHEQVYNCSLLYEYLKENITSENLTIVNKNKHESVNEFSIEDIPDFTQCVTFGTLSESGARLYNVYTMIIQFLIPVVAMLLCYVLIIVKLKIKHRRQMKG